LVDRQHDPGPAVATQRRSVVDDPSLARRRIGGADLRIGVASWTDRTIIPPGVFYPPDVKTPEDRLRYYASRFSLVEVDSTYYALPTPENAERWVDRTPENFTFNVKAHALMTGHATETVRLPRALREALPPALQEAPRVYAKDLPPEIRNEVWRLFRDALTPLQKAGKLGAVLLQLAPWIRPNRHTPKLLARIREQLGDLPVAVEFRHPSWLAPRLRERVWEELLTNDMTYVVVDTPPDTQTSVPRLAAVTTPRLAMVRLHGRRSDLWGARNAPVVEKYRYLYDRHEMEEWLTMLEELAEQSEQVHVVFNNCYANYGVTNALELGGMLKAGDRGSG
jgi:uncharacterized protein YecE (DUF72 family)